MGFEGGQMNTNLSIQFLTENNLGTGYIKQHMKSQSLQNSDILTRGEKCEVKVGNNQYPKTCFCDQSSSPLIPHTLNYSKLNLSFI